MNIVSAILSNFFGNKSTKDIQDVTPLVELVKTEFEQVKLLSNNELRAHSHKLKEDIRLSIRENLEQIDSLKAKVEVTEDFSEKEKIYAQIDKVDKEVDELLSTKLVEVLPQAFAIMKDTARRFFENETIEVDASENDRNLAATRESIEIIDNKAIWHTNWIAGGNRIRWDMVHYDVQLIGGVVLHQGKIAEMATGEGKTLVATLPVFLNALSGRGVHIVTVNDYLAKRDSEWMGPLYEFHGLTVDCIDRHQPNSDERRAAYNADITFGTNNEFGFDYLRDNMSISPQDLVQRGHNYGIVDEVDSVLIDDARTPLIISGPVPKGEDQLFDELKPRVENLVNAQKKLVNEILAAGRKALNETNNEQSGLLLLRAYKGLPKNKALIKILSEQGNKALMHKTENTYMADNSKNMHVVTDDLFFVIDEKNNSIELTDKGIDMLTSSAEDTSFFILPDIGAEIADIEKKGLKAEEKLVLKDQMLQDYAIKSERLHTIHQLTKAYTLFEKDDEYVVMDNQVKIVDEQTGRILDGRRYSDGLHQAIEAKERVKVEAATQTFATITLQNYFRMYKKLAGMTGTAETEAGELWNIYKLDVVVIPTNKPVVRKDSEDLVYKTKREKYNAVIDEIASLMEKGRPVLVGTTSVEISELLSRMLKMKGIKHNVLNAKLHQKEADIVAEAGRKGMVTIATNMAGRGTDIKITQEVKDSGGLAIIGTERHESRRVDRQLRGRSGRQGDPGSSIFFVSLEDELMRLFGSDRIAGLMDKLGLKEGEVIQHSMITKSIERAQRKVEENNFGIRKRLLEYDDVMNSQREVIYTRRRHALYGERLDVDISNMMYDVCQSIVDEFQGSADFDDFNFQLIRILSMESPVSRDEYLALNSNEVVEMLFKDLMQTYKRKSDHIAGQAMPVIKDVFENNARQYENIVVPISDGHRVFQIITNLQKAYETKGLDLVHSWEKAVILNTIDEAWKEHLREMDDLRQSVQNAAYEQKDPLLIYKFESYELFKTMLDKVNKDITAVLLKGHIPIQDSSGVQRSQGHRKLDMSQMRQSKSEFQSGLTGGPPAGSEPQKQQTIRVERKSTGMNPVPAVVAKNTKIAMVQR